MSARPSSQALARLPGDAPGPTTRQIPRDAVVRVTFATPSLLAAVDGKGGSATLPPVKAVIGRVAQRTGDSLWVAVSEVTGTTGETERYPARGVRARLLAVSPNGEPSKATIQVLNAHPRRAELALTSGIVTFFVLVTAVALYCSQEPCMN